MWKRLCKVGWAVVKALAAVVAAAEALKEVVKHVSEWLKGVCPEQT